MRRIALFISFGALLAAAAAFPVGSSLFAQNRLTYPVVTAESGHVALGLAIRKLAVSGTFMQAVAHPDDEHNALFALYTHGMGLRSIDVQTNRGEGGQNEIGPELFRDIGVLRTSELLSAHRIDGAQQYFTRAIDYGYSFSPDEVIGKWGHDEIVGDFVRLIRTLRPDVFLTMNIQGRGGDRAHEATTVLARDAYYAAGDPNKYPEQIREGLRPWRPKKLYFSGGFGGGRGGPGGGRGGAADSAPSHVARINTSAYDQLLGRTYAEIGTDARSNHKCQGTGSGLPPIPGIAGGRGGFFFGGAFTYQLMDATIAGQKDKDETSLFDGIDISIPGLASYAGSNPPAALTTGLSAIVEQAQRAQKAFDAGNDAATIEPIEAGLAAVRALESQLATIAPDDSARYEIGYRLGLKERDFEDAAIAAHGLTFDAVADDGLVIAGQPVGISIVAMNRGVSDATVSSVSIAGLAGAAGCAPGAAKKDVPYTCTVNLLVPNDARLTEPYFTDDYWKHPANPARNAFEPGVPFGVPFAPSPFHVTFRVKTGAAEISKDLPIQFRYIKDVFSGDKRMELNVVPAFSVRVTPALAVIPAARTSAARAAVEREIHVSVTNGTKGAARASVALNVPDGWKVVPATATLDFSHEDEALSARFRVTAPAAAKLGDYPVRAVVTSASVGGAAFSSGYQEIEYPHVQRRQVIKPAATTMKVIDVKTTPSLHVGYIVGVGDQVPPAIEQLDAKLDYIEPDELAWGDLAKYDVIVTGVRAYERRGDLRAYNRRLLDYAERGGVVIVQYNKNEFNQQQYGPFPARVSGNRVTGEDAPVTILEKEHPVFTRPNRIGDATWSGWVQERGLYFLGEKDPKYVDLVSMVDPFPDNPGEKRGALVEAKVGKGRWLYVGLALWRQLPAGTEGAYQLLANLLSLPKTPVVPAVR